MEDNSEHRKEHLSLIAKQRVSPLPVLLQYRLVMQALLAEYRLEWPLYITLGVLFPFGFVLFTKFLLQSLSLQRAIFLLGGDMTMSLAFGPTLSLMSKMGWARQCGDCKYWATLPVAKIVFVVALISVTSLQGLPSLIFTYIIGSFVLGLPFSGGWAFVLFVPLGALSLAGLGALVGSYMPGVNIANICGNILGASLAFLSPLMIPQAAFPLPLSIASWFIPTTYVADSFRSALSGTMGMNVVRDGVILSIFSTVCLLVTQWKLDWRTK